MKKESEGREEFKANVVEKRKGEAKKQCGRDRKWEKPLLEDVSGRVMAQPYIRFT